MVLKNSKQPRTPSEEAGPSNKPDLHAASDSPQPVDDESLSALTESLSIRDQEDAEHASPQQPVNPIRTQSGSGSQPETSRVHPAPASGQNSAERSRRIRRGQIRHQVRRVLDLISMVCWGDLETAVSMLRRSYVRALHRVNRGDPNTFLFHPNDPDFGLYDDNHTFGGGYQDWVFPLWDNHLHACSLRRIRRPRRCLGGNRVTIDGQGFDFDDDVIVVRLHGGQLRSRFAAGHRGQRCHTRPQGQRAGHPAPERPPAVLRHQGSHLRRSLHNPPKEDEAEPSPSQATQNHSQTNTATPPPPNAKAHAHTAGPLGRPTSSRTGLQSPHHTARYRQEWSNFIRREADNPLILRERSPRQYSDGQGPSTPDGQV